MGFFKDRLNNIVDKSKKVIGTEEIVANAKYIKEGVKILSTAPSNNRVRKIGEKPKSFNDIIKENNLNQNDLIILYKKHAIMFYIFFVSFLACFVSMLLSFTNNKTIDIFFQFLPSLSIGVAFLLLSLRNGLAAYQIKYRDLISIKEFINKGIKIFPSFDFK